MTIQRHCIHAHPLVANLLSICLFSSLFPQMQLALPHALGSKEGPALTITFTNTCLIVISFKPLKHSWLRFTPWAARKEPRLEICATSHQSEGHQDQGDQTHWPAVRLPATGVRVCVCLPLSNTVHTNNQQLLLFKTPVCAFAQSMKSRTSTVSTSHILQYIHTLTCTTHTHTHTITGRPSSPAHSRARRHRTIRHRA